LCKPIIFFECEFQNIIQIKNFVQTIKKLKNLEFNNWTIFDNYGSIIFDNIDIDYIFKFINYIQFQNEKKTTRTIYYFDILTYHDKDLEKVNNSISKYNNFIKN